MGVTNTVPLFALPTRFKGELCLEFKNNTNFFKHVTDLLYGGTTLTVGNKFTHFSGLVSSVSVSISGGNLVVSFYSASVITLSITVDFKGEFYQA